MKALMLICDGMADRPVPELGNLTPLEAAQKPNMNGIARRGICGLMDTIAPGVPPGSDTAHLALLGYDPFEVYTGRGPFEAAGAGIDLRAGDIAFRVNYATIDEKLIVKDRRAGRIQDTKQLEVSIQRIKLSGTQILFKSTVAHRATLVIRGKGLSHEVSDSDPHKTDTKVLRVKALSSKAAKTAKLLNEFSRKAYKVLKNHPLNQKRSKQGLPQANYLLLRGAGVAPHLEPLQQKYGFKSACVAAAALVKGVCRMAGMEIIEVPGATGGVNTDLNAKAKAALRALENHELVLLHVKGFDEASHDGNHNAKVKLIERTDAMLGQLIDKTDYIMLTIDHTTPVSVHDHTGDPVPIVISGPAVRADDVRNYDERSTAKGGLGRIRGKYLLPILADLMGKSKKFGA
ncbi:MAG: 2,3-bisphosphoglycerate-independent phosphoglycerate mutase [Hadesarchaea archaeon]|nr:2,3-bisphosphoglycerate-independent phosphoglycerate mutase [Hadesarchaea archaeon]